MINDEFLVGTVVHHKGDAYSCLRRAKKSFHMEHVKMVKNSAQSCVQRHMTVQCQQI